MSALVQPPQPPPHPLLGNAPDVGLETPLQRLMGLAQTYGPIFRMRFPMREMMLVSSHELVDELCDASRFEKALLGPLENLRELAGDGLFTARNDEPNWGRAHRLLAPAFGALAMRSYFDRMLDIAEQMFDKWARLGPKARLDVSDNMTRLTLDTIALCGFDHRLNSFYQNEPHPFVEAMVRALRESHARSTMLPIQQVLRFQAARTYRADIARMNRMVDDVIAERRAAAEGPARGDLLERMLRAVDPQSGEGLSDENIRFQIITFLIAGHETTSGLLSFAVHYLLQDPEVLRRARAEVDRVMGRQRPRFEHLPQLVYIDQILRETLRIWPTAPAFALHPKAPTVLGGRYAVEPSDVLAVLVPSLHRDPAVWEAPERFDPERFAPERRAQIPANAWKPFGHGKRACIGRLFALQEATLVLAMMLQRFELIDGFDTPLVVKESLTLKPDGLFIRVQERGPVAVGQPAPARPPEAAPQPAAQSAHNTPLTVLFGSNTGTAEALARRLAEGAAQAGYTATVGPMDGAVDALPAAGALVVVTASYNGQPPDNARAFCDWLDALPAGVLAGRPVAVLGCGHRDWAQTFQAVPRRVGLALERLGAEVLVDAGSLDGAGDVEDQAARWLAGFWPALHQRFGVAHAAGAAPAPLELELLPPEDPLLEAHGMQWAEVEAVRELVDMASPLGRSKREVVLRLPLGLAYRPGQHLAVLGQNPPARVEAWLQWLGLPASAQVRARSGGRTALPTDRPVALETVLARYLDLGQPASKRALRAVAEAVRCPPERPALDRWISDDNAYQHDVLDKRLTLLDVLGRCPSARLSLAAVLDLLPAMQPRRYSISSAPGAAPRRCALTVAWVQGPAWSGAGRFEGVASGTLCRAEPGARIPVAVRAPHGRFALPEDPGQPVIFIGAGAGMAPFRGFLEARAAQQAAGETVAPALFFFGCRRPGVDLLYADELAQWTERGLVDLRLAASRPAQGAGQHVQDRLWADREEVRAWLDRGAVVYVCGDGAGMAPGVRAVLGRLLAGEAPETAEASVQALIDAGRLQLDVFG
jgi:cytochrome P450/NADPH-cytochrome P450 reductase